MELIRSYEKWMCIGIGYIYRNNGIMTGKDDNNNGVFGWK
jgi:hypothetical protein